MIDTLEIDDHKLESLLERTEGHFFDFKSRRINPAKLSKTVCAFANADGGEVYIGIEDPKSGGHWDGFETDEEANSHIALLDELFPLGTGFSYSFLVHKYQKGKVLWIEVGKTNSVFRASDSEIYVRRGAQDIKQVSAEQIKRIEYNKGITSYEDQRVQTSIDDVANSITVLGFILDVIPDVEPTIWLRKQRLIVEDLPTVTGVVLFSDEPQAALPKTSIKIYRYKSSEREGSRATLEFDPISIEGPAYDLIHRSVQKVKDLIERISVVGEHGLEKVQYPPVAIHEIVTNAVLHRDYSINDDIHVRIFDDRIEVESPGRLPAHITERNILSERFARNPKLVRLINKFRNPPNKDVGEGLNTSFQAMRELKLRDPTISQLDNSVLVTMRHEKLGSSEEIITEYLRDNEEINNTKARELCFIGDANKMKRVFQRMMQAGIIERIDGRSQSKAAYRRGSNFPR